MRLLICFLIAQIVMVAPLLLSPAKADNIETCNNLFRPSENKAHGVKARGGVWALFEKREIYRKYAIIGLHVDSKITSLMYTINYVCERQHLNICRSQRPKKNQVCGFIESLKG